MDHFIGIFLAIVIPAVLGLLAIAIPFRSHRATKRDRFLTLGAVNAAGCGVAVIVLLGGAVFNWYPTFLPYLAIAVGFSAMVLLELTKNIGRKKTPPPRPHDASTKIEN